MMRRHDQIQAFGVDAADFNPEQGAAIQEEGLAGQPVAVPGRSGIVHQGRIVTNDLKRCAGWVNILSPLPLVLFQPGSQRLVTVRQVLQGALQRRRVVLSVKTVGNGQVVGGALRVQGVFPDQPLLVECQRGYRCYGVGQGGGQGDDGVGLRPTGWVERVRAGVLCLFGTFDTFGQGGQ